MGCEIPVRHEGVNGGVLGRLRYNKICLFLSLRCDQASVGGCWFGGVSSGGGGSDGGQ